MTDERITDSEAGTIDAGRALGASLEAGAVLLLVGELGAGKTAFVKGLAAGLGIPAEEVSSPTFALIQEYRGRVTLFHVDLYRITSAEADDLGLDELRDQGVVAIEWGDKLNDPPPLAVEVRFEDLGGDRRRLTIVGRPGGDPGPKGDSSYSER